MSRFENRISRTDLYRIAKAFADVFVASYKKPPKAILLDIDDTEDKVYGSQQLSLFNAYFKSYCYQPLHIYEGQTGKLITTILRPGARPSGKQIVSILKRVVAYLRRAWPNVAILLRGDSHFSCPEVHALCDTQNVYFVLGQSGNAKLLPRAQPLMDQAKALYAASGKTVRLFSSWDYQASTWASPRRIICKAEVTPQGDNIRFVATNLQRAKPSFIYKTVYCGRGLSAGQAGWKASSRITRPFSILIAPLFTRLKPITSGSFSTAPPMSCCRPWLKLDCAAQRGRTPSIICCKIAS